MEMRHILVSNTKIECNKKDNSKNEERGWTIRWLKAI